MEKQIKLYLSILYETYLVKILSDKPDGVLNSPKLMCLIIVSCLGTSACSAANQTSSQTATAPTTLNEKIVAIDEEVATMASDTYCEVTTDCAFLAMGERACGGPSSYKIYSKKLGEDAVSKLRALAAESTVLAKQANQKSGLLSTCEFYPLPSLSCIENQCVENKSEHPTY